MGAPLVPLAKEPSMTALRQRMLEDMQIRNLSPHTQRAYLENVARFARHFHRSSAALGPEEIRTYQVYLTCERKLAPSSIEIAVCALRFLYKVTLKHAWPFHDVIPAPKKPRPLPTATRKPSTGFQSVSPRTTATTIFPREGMVGETSVPTTSDARRIASRTRAARTTAGDG